MIKHFFTIVSVFTLSVLTFGQTTADQKAEAYIRRFAKTAVTEMEKYKVPASITLAQGMLESSFGESRLATEGNNHFGVKCHSDWTGEKIYKDDDKNNECFRKYTSAWFSFRDHSKFLQKPRYQSLYKLDKTDYKGWAKGLKDAGYATNSKYPELLIKKIEDYKLYQYDVMTSSTFDAQLETAIKNTFTGDNTTVAPPKETKPSTKKPKENTNPQQTANTGESHTVHFHKTGNLPYIIAEEDDTWDDISLEFGIKIKKLSQYNDVSIDRPLQEGQYVFLKKKKAKAKDKTYRVKSGDTMYTISQKMGIQLSKLYEKNRMRVGQQVEEGEILNLRRTKKQ